MGYTFDYQKFIVFDAEKWVFPAHACLYRRIAEENVPKLDGFQCLNICESIGCK